MHIVWGQYVYSLDLWWHFLILFIIKLYLFVTIIVLIFGFYFKVGWKKNDNPFCLIVPPLQKW